MIVKLLTEHHLECLRLKGGCRGSCESTLVRLLESSCRSFYFLYMKKMKEKFARYIGLFSYI